MVLGGRKKRDKEKGLILFIVVLGDKKKELRVEKMVFFQSRKVGSVC